MYVKSPLLDKDTVPYAGVDALVAVNGNLASPVPPCSPVPVAVNTVPGLLSAAPIAVKSVSPVVTIVYSFPAINAPSVISPAVSLDNTLPFTAVSYAVLKLSSNPLPG